MGIFNSTLVNVSEANHLLGFMQQVNIGTGGALGIGFFLSMFVILFFSMTRWSTKIAFASTSYTMSIIAIAMTVIDLLPTWGFAVSIALLITGFFFHTKVEGGGV